MDQNFSHKIKAAKVTVAYFHNAKNGYDVQIHKAGCAHEAKAETVRAYDPTGALSDDWFYVAPCARKA